MSDYEDYENNLAFDPTANSGFHRSYTDRTQSTIELIEKIEQLTKQLDVKEAMIKNYTAEIETQRQQLAIAVKGLQYYANKDIYDRHHQIVNGNNEWESEVMLDCGVKADYALKKIEGVKK